VQGNSILLWKDKWTDISLQEKWPHLFSFVKNESISLKEALDSPHVPELFQLPLSEEALVQLNFFQALLQDLLPNVQTQTPGPCWAILQFKSQKFIRRSWGMMGPYLL
jgi:hypothetical protein